MHVQPGGREILQPGPDLCPLLSFRNSGKAVRRGLEGGADRLVGLQIRMLQAVHAVVIVGRINHRADIIQVLCHGPVILAHDSRVRLPVYHCAEHVRRHLHSQRRKRLIGIGRKFCDQICLGFFQSFFPIIRFLIGNFCGKTDIVKLNFVKAQGCRLLRHLHQVVPDLPPVGVHPGQPVPVHKDAAVLSLDAEIRPLRSQQRILKGHYPGDPVDILLAQPGKEARQIRDIIHVRSQLLHHRFFHFIGNDSFIVFDVNHHGVQLTVPNQLDQLLHIGMASHGPGHIDPPDRLRFRRRDLFLHFLRHLLQSSSGRQNAHFRHLYLLFPAGSRQEAERCHEDRCRRQEACCSLFHILSSKASASSISVNVVNLIHIDAGLPVHNQRLFHGHPRPPAP